MATGICGTRGCRHVAADAHRHAVLQTTHGGADLLHDPLGDGGGRALHNILGFGSSRQPQKKKAWLGGVQTYAGPDEAASELRRLAGESVLGDVGLPSSCGRTTTTVSGVPKSTGTLLASSRGRNGRIRTATLMLLLVLEDGLSSSLLQRLLLLLPSPFKPLVPVTLPRPVALLPSSPLPSPLPTDESHPPGASMLLR